MNYQDLLVKEDLSLIDALHKLDETAQKVLFVVRDGKLAAALTDGDIRRYIMRSGNLTASISSMANYHPKYISAHRRAEAEAMMRHELIFAMPVVDDSMRVVDVLLWNEEKPAAAREKLHVPVVINAGGKGTRLYPYTKILPKPLIPIGEIPIAEHIINRFHQMGCDRFYMIVNEKKNMIKAYFNEIEKDYALTFADEETALGTGGGLRLLKTELDGPFIFANCDTIIDLDFARIVEAHRESGNTVTMICATKTFTFPFGVVEAGANGVIQALKEKPRSTYLTNTGCYIVEPTVIDRIGENEAIGFPSVVERCMREGLRAGIYPISEQSWMDMGQFDTMQEMEKRLYHNE